MMKVAASSSDKGARGQCSDLERGMVKWNDATPSQRNDRRPKRGGAVVGARNIGKQKRRGDGMAGSASHAHLRGDASHGRAPEGWQRPCAQGGKGEGLGVSNASRPCPRPALTRSTVAATAAVDGGAHGARVCDGPDGDAFLA